MAEKLFYLPTSPSNTVSLEFFLKFMATYLR
jgi:hypothetical protein